MISPEKTIRNYKISDSEMLIDNEACLAEFLQDKADFIKFDPDFDGPFEKNWDTSLKTAIDVSTDEDTLDVQSGYTEDVENIMADCRNAYQDAKYFIEKAFPTKHAVWKEFGSDNYDKARKSVSKMKTFMTVLSKKTLKYKTQLLAAHFPQKSIDNIIFLAQALSDAKTTQETVKNSRYSITDDRVTKLNATWEFRTKVAKASKYIYKNNYGKYKQYLLPASEESASVFNILGVITDKATGTKLEHVHVVLNTPTPTDTFSDSQGEFGFANVSDASYTVTFTLSGYKTVTENVIFSGKQITLNIALEKI